MGYGGPRIEFYIQPDYDNYTRRIKKEGEARIQAHYDAQERVEWLKERERKERAFQQAEEVERQRLAEEKAEYREILDARKEEEERRRTGKAPTKKLTPAEKRAIEYNIQRRKELAVPKANPQPAYGGTMFGRCMYQKTRYVEYPQGRAGQPYCPGVDRDRIIPDRPNPKDLPPWIGSYSSHKSILSEPMMRKAKEEETDYYCRDAPYRTEAEKRARRDKIDAMLYQMDSDAADQQNGAAEVPSGSEGNFLPPYTTATYNNNMDDDTPSIFSHADSNGPIIATGAQHLDYYSTKSEVDTHLKNYGGAMTGPRKPYKPDIYVEQMNLPQLQERVIRLQDRPKKL